MEPRKKRSSYADFNINVKNDLSKQKLFDIGKIASAPLEFEHEHADDLDNVLTLINKSTNEEVKRRSRKSRPLTNSLNDTDRYSTNSVARLSKQLSFKDENNDGNSFELIDRNDRNDQNDEVVNQNDNNQYKFHEQFIVDCVSKALKMEKDNKTDRPTVIIKNDNSVEQHHINDHRSNRMISSLFSVIILVINILANSVILLLMLIGKGIKFDRYIHLIAMSFLILSFLLSLVAIVCHIKLVQVWFKAQRVESDASAINYKRRSLVLNNVLVFLLTSLFITNIIANISLYLFIDGHVTI